MISIKPIVRQVIGINTAEQSFECRICIHITCPTKPEIFFENLRDDMNIVEEHWDGNSTYEITCHNTFIEHMELATFPFDQQALHIKMRWNNMPFYSEEGVIESFLPQDDWKLFNKVWVCNKKEHVIFVFFVQRYGGFIIWNVMVPIFLMVMLSFVSFVLQVDDFSTRFNIVFTLLLTLVASKFNIMGLVPQTNYLTYLDKYMVLAFFYMCAVAGQNTYVYYLNTKEDHNDKEVNSVDNMAGSILFGVWCIIHLIISILAYMWSKTKILRKTSDYIEVLRNTFPPSLRSEENV
jgi:hypothetical protein